MTSIAFKLRVVAEINAARDSGTNLALACSTNGAGISSEKFYAWQNTLIKKGLWDKVNKCRTDEKTSIGGINPLDDLDMREVIKGPARQGMTEAEIESSGSAEFKADTPSLEASGATENLNEIDTLINDLIQPEAEPISRSLTGMISEWESHAEKLTAADDGTKANIAGKVISLLIEELKELLDQSPELSGI